ncbi:unnamed protein product, partial [Pylaiella littoralis]
MPTFFGYCSVSTKLHTLRIPAKFGPFTTGHHGREVSVRGVVSSGIGWAALLRGFFRQNKTESPHDTLLVICYTYTARHSYIPWTAARGRYYWCVCWGFDMMIEYAKGFDHVFGVEDADVILP